MRISTDWSLVMGKIYKLLKNRFKNMIRMNQSLHRENPGPVFQINENGKIETANPAAFKVFGKTLGNQFNDLCSEVPIEDLQALFNEGGTKTYEVERRGKHYLLQLVGVPSSSVINVYGIDITDSKILQAQVMQSAKLASIGEMAAGVGHEINNPLAIIQGNIEMIEELALEKDSSSMLLDSFKAVNQSMDRINKIVASLRNFSREDIEANDELNIHEQLKEVSAMVQKILQSQDVKLITDFKAEKNIFVGHPGRFQQVVMNMVSNSTHALEGIDNGEITLSTYNNGENLCLQVKDNGCGVSDKIKNQIFESFFTTKPRGKGTGLGLGISQNIIKELGGEIKVESEVGKGSCFTIELPFVDGEAELPNNVIPFKKAEVAKEKILIVDDEEGVRNVLSRLLLNEGYDVYEATDGEDAFNKIEKNNFSAVFADIKMPKMDGYRLFRKIRTEVSKDIKLFLVTGGTVDQDSGQDDILYKPFRRLDILELLSNHFSKSQKAA